MDTFNFSFFDDKAEGQSKADANGAAPAEEARHSLPAPPEESDPFSLDDFDFGADLADAPDSSSDDSIPGRASVSSSTISPDLDLGTESHFNPSFALDDEEFPDLALSSGDKANALTPQLESENLAFDEPLAFNENSVAPEVEEHLAAPDSNTQVPVQALELEAPVPEIEMPAPVPPMPVAAPATPTATTSKGARFLTQDNPWDEVAPRRERLRVAIMGASGIGFNHARWLAKHGAEIVGFLGSGEESVSATGQKLENLLGYAAPGFLNAEQLLAQTTPQAVCVASPPELHFAQALASLEAGAHVLCEKPLVYAAGRSKRENRDGARELLKTAAKKNLVLATQLQYGAATPILCRLAGVSPFEVGDFAMEIETTNSNSPRDPKALWVDLGPHPLSIAQFLSGENGELIEETVQVVPSQTSANSEVSVRFGVRCDGGRLLMCRAIVRRFNPGIRPARRRFSFNGRVVQYSGVKAPDRSYVAQYTAPDGYISHYPDPVDFLVGNFVRSCWGDDQLAISPAQGVQNLDWLLSIGDKIDA